MHAMLAAIIHWIQSYVEDILTIYQIYAMLIKFGNIQVLNIFSDIRFSGIKRMPLIHIFSIIIIGFYFKFHIK